MITSKGIDIKIQSIYVDYIPTTTSVDALVPSEVIALSYLSQRDYFVFRCTTNKLFPISRHYVLNRRVEEDYLSTLPKKIINVVKKKGVPDFLCYDKDKDDWFFVEIKIVGTGLSKAQIEWLFYTREKLILMYVIPKIGMGEHRRYTTHHTPVLTKHTLK